MHATVLSEDLDLAASSLALSSSELAIVRAYAKDRRATEWFIANYRFRMSSSYVNALETGAPLTHRALRAIGHDIEASSRAFLDSMKWRDFGPFVYSYCALLLDDLSKNSEILSAPSVGELIRLEQAAVKVIMDAASSMATNSDSPSLRQSTSMFEAVRCNFDLTFWLRDKTKLGLVQPPAQARWLVAYLRSLNEPIRYVALPDRAVTLLLALRKSRSKAELTAELKSKGLIWDQSREEKMLQQLAGIGLLTYPLF